MARPRPLRSALASEAGGGDEALNELAGQMRELVMAMAKDQPSGIKVPRIVEFAVAAVPGAQHAAISMIRGSEKPETISATDDLPLQVDAIQYELNEGPCVQALIRSDLVWSDDLSNDDQWPRFGPRAAQATGIRSMASYRLFLTEDQRGSLNLYSAKPQAFDTLSRGVGALFAAYASLTLLNDIHQNKAMQLERALESNREIGIAMGILMARHLCTTEQAFGMLRSASQHTNRKLRDIATDVQRTGSLPDLRTPR